MGFSGNGYTTASTVITSEGDLRIGNSVGAAERLAIGSSGKLLKSNGTTASWQTVDTADSIITAQGDIIYGDASNDGAALSAGTSGYFLKTQGTSANPIWASVSASPTTETVSATITSSWTSTSSSFVDVTGMTLTKPDITDGKCITNYTCIMKNSISLQVKALVLVDENDVVLTGGDVEQHTNTAKGMLSGGATSDADGEITKLQAKAGGGGGTIEINYDSGVAIPLLCTLGVG